MQEAKQMLTNSIYANRHNEEIIDLNITTDLSVILLGYPSRH